MPRPIRTPLTDRAIRDTMPGRTPIDLRDGGLRGLILTVHVSGKRQWSIRYCVRDERKNAIVHRRAVLGTYPTMSIAQARKAARPLQSKIDAAGDPVAERLAAAAVRTDTVEALADDYLAQHAKKTKKSWPEDERMLNAYVLPRWRSRSVAEITRREVRTLVEGIADGGAPIMANRVLGLIRKMFNVGIEREWLEGNVAALIKKPGTEQSRERVLTDDEIRALWALLHRFPSTTEKPAPGRRRAKADAHGRPFCPLSPALAAVQQLRLLTAQRGGEVIHMRWADLDLDGGWWTIPAEYAKNGKLHRVPLSADARAIIAAQQPAADKRAGFVFADDGGALPVDRLKKAGAECARALKTDIRSHDLRRTAATGMTKAGIPAAHVSHVLNHTPSGAAATRTYDRHTYDNEKRIALDSWARTLRAILKGQTGATVVPMTKSRRRA